MSASPGARQVVVAPSPPSTPLRTTNQSASLPEAGTYGVVEVPAGSRREALEQVGVAAQRRDHRRSRLLCAPEVHADRRFRSATRRARPSGSGDLPFSELQQVLRDADVVAEGRHVVLHPDVQILHRRAAAQRQRRGIADEPDGARLRVRNQALRPVRCRSWQGGTKAGCSASEGGAQKGGASFQNEPELESGWSPAASCRRRA